MRRALVRNTGARYKSKFGKGGCAMAHPDQRLDEALLEHQQAIHGYILGIVRDTAEAEDLTQETMLRAHRKLSTLEDPARLLPWLYRIATNICHDRFRQASFRNRPRSLGAPPEGESDRSEANDVTAPGPRLDLALEQEEMSACVQRYLAQLDDPYRAAILLHDVEGLTNPEIAEMLDVSLATVKIRLHRARSKLRATLGQACSFSCDDRGVVVCEPKPREDKQ